MFLNGMSNTSQIGYLRLSITENCNFRCTYCLPNGNAAHGTATHSPRIHMSPKEFAFLVRAFAKLGVKKVRLTGGEPGTRADLLEIARTLSLIPQIQELAITTNGTALFPTNGASVESRLQSLVQAGIARANVSVDSLNPQIFEAITGKNTLAPLLSAIETATRLSFPIKINCVVMNGVNSHELPQWLEFVRTNPITVRFIELMPTKGSEHIFAKKTFPLTSWEESLAREGWSPSSPDSLAGPAKEYSHPNFAGCIGFITPVSHSFCATCNRLRATSMGLVHMCAFDSQGHNVRHLLQSPLQEKELLAELARIVSKKGCGKPSHSAPSLFTQSFARLGG
jgi:cyclic pyranopterin phosphate synthase